MNGNEAKALLDAATPGPWDLVTCGFRGRSVGYTVSQQSSGRDIFEGPEGEQAICDAGDAALIAAAPDLAAAIIELEAEVERLNAEVRREAELASGYKLDREYAEAERDALQARIDRALWITEDEIVRRTWGHNNRVKAGIVRALYHEALGEGQ